MCVCVCVCVCTVIFVMRKIWGVCVCSYFCQGEDLGCVCVCTVIFVMRKIWGVCVQLFFVPGEVWVVCVSVDVHLGVLCHLLLSYLPWIYDAFYFERTFKERTFMCVLFWGGGRLAVIQ